MNKEIEILGIDAGNNKAKTAGRYGVDSYKTNICNWFERDVKEVFGMDDMEFTIHGRKGFAGSIAEAEDEFGDGTRYGDSKAHEETRIRVLLAIHRYMEMYCPNARNVCLVTGQPIVSHKEHEKEKIIKMLKGHHEFVVNGTQREIYIQDVRIATEGGAAFWADPQLPPGKIFIIDIGSGTVNLCAISEKRFIHQSSGTMNIGMETMKNKTDLEGMTRGIIQSSTKLKWKKEDNILVCGGIANIILPYIKKHYINAEVLRPQLKRDHDILQVKPVFANAVGFYHLAKGAFS